MLVALGALLLAASYPPFHLPFLSFVAIAPAVVLLRRLELRQDTRGALRWGFWYGFVTQGAVLYWLVVALWHFTPFSALGYLATIALFGLWHALLFWLVVRVRLRFPVLPLWVALPVAWTAVEWAVGHQGDIRFPWLGLGTSLADAPVLVQWADIAGARGVTLWLGWCNVMLVEAADSRAAIRARARDDRRGLGLRRVAHPDAPAARAGDRRPHSAERRLPGEMGSSSRR